jgi:predicted DNA-binding transcriptional regulator AlpA
MLRTPPHISPRIRRYTVKIIRPKEAQARLGIGHSKFYDAIKKGELPKPVRFGRVTGLLEEELDAAIRGLKAERDRQHGEAS